MEKIGDILKKQPRHQGALLPTPGADPEPDALPDVCSHCHGDSFYTLDVPVGHPDFGRAITCECQREVLAHAYQAKLLEECELPRGTLHMTLEGFEVSSATQDAYAAALAMAAGNTDSPLVLTFAGSPGAGKTHLAVGIVRCWLAREVSARYIYVPRLLATLRQGFRDEEDDYDKRLARLYDVGLLVLDDLGAEHQTSWAQEQLEMIVNQREIHERPMVITTNLAPAALSERIASRLRDTASGRTVGMKAPDYRLTRGSK